MKRLVAAFLLLALTNSLMGYAPTINVSVQDFKMLRSELLNSRTLLGNLNREILDLQTNLKEAQNSYEISDQKIRELELSLDGSERNLSEADRLLEVSRMRIEDLENRLNTASEEQRALQIRVGSLENLLTALLESLNLTEVTLDQNEERIIEEVMSLEASYQRRIVVYRIATWVLGTLLAGTVVYAISGTLHR